MNFVLKGERALPITSKVKETFHKINDVFVTNGMHILNMIKVGHRYSEEVFCDDTRKSTHCKLTLHSNVHLGDKKV